MALDNISEMTLEECEKKLDELLDSDDAEDEDIIALYTAMGDKAKEEGEFEKSKEYYMNALTETLMKYGKSISNFFSALGDKTAEVTPKTK